MKVAPEHVNTKVLAAMKKPTHDTFEDFAEKFAEENKKAGKKQFLVPYFIASHPASSLSVQPLKSGNFCSAASSVSWTSSDAPTLDRK